MPDPLLPSCSILLLAGGRGQRMGGQDKGLVEWQGRPLIAWLHETVQPLTDDLLLSCNRNRAHYSAYADRLISDEEQGFPGPLAGIRSGLAAARNAWMLVLPCDTPLIDRPLLQSLYQTALEEPDRPVMLSCEGQWEPLFSIIPTGRQAEVDACWQSGERSPLRALLHLGARALEVHRGDPRLANLNTPELLKITGSRGTSS
ncbi:molybdenum cofactor guanylyltransferase MobA [Stutzerimonas xanthomarina]|nr:molybdenum cofactor guanylyltransferase MobA [Stutzerimonas xanthomarina]